MALSRCVLASQAVSRYIIGELSTAEDYHGLTTTGHGHAISLQHQGRISVLSERGWRLSQVPGLVEANVPHAAHAQQLQVDAACRLNECLIL